MSQDTMTYTEQKIAKNKEQFAIGKVVGVQNSEISIWGGLEYSKAVVTRHTKNLIVVQYLDNNAEKINKEGSYKAETLKAIGSGSSLYVNRLVNWHEDLTLEREITDLDNELRAARRQLGYYAGHYNYKGIKEQAEKITQIATEIEEKRYRYFLAVDYSIGL